MGTDEIEGTYLGILGRLPTESETAWWQGRGAPFSEKVCRNILASREFRSKYLDKKVDVYRGHTEQDLDVLLEISERVGDIEPNPERITDFLGITTDPDFFSNKSHMKGQVNASPFAPSFHEGIEFLGTALAARRETDQETGQETDKPFCAVEIGAGWAPWLVAGARMAELMGRGIGRLVAVEADPEHVKFCERHVAENGYAGSFTIHHGLAGIEDGTGEFPVIDPQMHWGAGGNYDGTSKDPRPMQPVAVFDVGRICEEIAAEHGYVDLLHVDIQGYEGTLFLTLAERLAKTVHTVVIGTHGRQEEADILAAMKDTPFQLRHEKPARYQCFPQEPKVTVDGTQIWVNTAL